jgi:hypothetical protein
MAALGQTRHPGVWKMVSCSKQGDILTLTLAGPTHISALYDNNESGTVNGDCGDFEIYQPFVRVTEPLAVGLAGKTYMCPKGLVPDQTVTRMKQWEWDGACAHIISERAK